MGLFPSMGIGCLYSNEKNLLSKVLTYFPWLWLHQIVGISAVVGFVVPADSCFCVVGGGGDLLGVTP
jgi:hypothetical protein